jgi:hypothetical protein
VNEVLLLHARDGYWAHRGSAGAANDQPSAERRCQPIQTTLKMRITLADSSTWDDKIPRLKPNIVSLKAGSPPGGSTTTSHGTSARSAARSTSAS